MAVTLEELEKRVTQIEQELARLRQLRDAAPEEETPAARGARLLARARREKPRLKKAMARALEEMGIQGEPVSPEQLREMMVGCGINPEDNLSGAGQCTSAAGTARSRSA